MSVFRFFWLLALACDLVRGQLIIQTVAGGGPNNIPALQAGLSYPWGVALDSNGNLFVSSGVRVFKVSPSGLLTVYAGSGFNGFGGDGGPATGASLGYPRGLAVDSQGNLYIADQANDRVRKVSATTGIITTVAGNGFGGFNGDNQSATNASLNLPDSVAVDASGNLYIGDTQNFRVRKLTVATGIITTVAGGSIGYSGDGGMAVNAGFQSLAGVAVDGSGNLYIADGLRVREVTVSTGIISTIAGSGVYGYDGDGHAAIAAKTSGAIGVALDQSGNVYFTDSLNNAIRKVDHLTQLINTVSYAVGNPMGLQVDGAGNMYYADNASQVVRRQAPSPNPSQTPPITVAGNGSVGGYSGDGGLATDASINPAGIVIDGAGNLEISDRLFRVFRVNLGSGVINSIAGTGAVGNGGNGGPAVNAQFTQLKGVATDSRGNVYIAEASGDIRRVDASTGIITTYAGLPGGSTANGIPATQARIAQPVWVSFDGQDNLYVTDIDSHRVRKIDAQTGIITTVAGSGDFRFNGDGGPATSAGLDPAGTTFDRAGNLFIADSYNARIRKVDAHTGVISSVAGNGVWAFSGDGGLATNASLSMPTGVAIDSNGNVFIADAGNYRIRRVDSITNIISTFAGTGQPGSSGDGGPPASATLNVGDIKIDGPVFYVAEIGGTRVRAITSAGSCFYTLSRAAANFDLSGGPGSFTVSTGRGCGWSVVSSAPWLTITGASGGTASGAVSFTVASNPNPSPRSGTLSVAGRTFSVTQAAFGVTMSVSRNSLQFGTTASGDIITSPQTVAVTFAGASNINWTASSNSSNISVAPTVGVGTGTFQVRVFGPASNGMVSVIANGVANSPQHIQVSTATVNQGAPFGSLDTPIDNTVGIAGAIPVTGWALDNVEVSKVTIWREPNANEQPGLNGLAYIGDAVFVADARPDVQSIYPNTPLSYRAGWGYMMLTNFLPNSSGSPGLGNGTYKLHAIAINKAGQTFDLGTRTIAVDNAHASKPFGTIDTPGQGDTLSGNAYVNFGWALTQNPYCIPSDGAKITVYLDSLPIGHPTYGRFRSDIATLFPGLCNTNGAVGFLYLDTTKLTNGVHTIAWAVYDNQGRVDGIGSRYFTVLSTGTANEPEAEQPIQLVTNATLTFRRGFDLNSEQESLKPGATGTYAAAIEELGRIEVGVNAAEGYLLVDGEHHPLPTGSSLKGGVFYWHAGPGFLGDYPLVFSRPDGSQVQMVIHVQPKGYLKESNR